MHDGACVGLIDRINRGSTEPVAAANDFANLAKNLKPDQSVVLLVRHGKESNFIYLTQPK